MKVMKKYSLAKILKSLLLLAVALIVLPYIVAPIRHDYKMHRFDASIKKIPAPDGYEKVAQKKWFGLLWACGNHADYLVIAVFRGTDNDAFVYDYFEKDFGVYCPEEESDAHPFIYKHHGGKWYYVGKDETVEENEDSMSDSTTGKSYITKFALESTEPLYFAVYTAQGEADSDLRTH